MQVFQTAEASNKKKSNARNVAKTGVLAAENRTLSFNDQRAELGLLQKRQDAADIRNVILQRKKAAPVAKEEKTRLISGLEDIVEQKIFLPEDTEEDKAHKIWEHASAIYDTNKDRGARYYGKLQTGIEKYTSSEQLESGLSSKQTFVANNEIKREAYDKTYSSSYDSAVKTDPEVNKQVVDDNPYHVFSLGREPLAEGERRVPKIPPYVVKNKDYYNTFDFEAGKINAKSNFAGSVDKEDWSKFTYYDEALEAGVGLNNSEILWQQASRAAKKKNANMIGGNSKQSIAADLKKLDQIKRSTVVNNETQEVMFMVHDGYPAYFDEKTVIPETNDFNAMLGTPNVRSSAYFLLDHLDQLEKTFENIAVDSVHDITINFKDLI